MSHATGEHAAGRVCLAAQDAWQCMAPHVGGWMWPQGGQCNLSHLATVSGRCHFAAMCRKGGSERLSSMLAAQVSLKWPAHFAAAVAPEHSFHTHTNSPKVDRACAIGKACSKAAVAAVACTHSARILALQLARQAPARHRAAQCRRGAVNRCGPVPLPGAQPGRTLT